jgi:hypothetical protein
MTILSTPTTKSQVNGQENYNMETTHLMDKEAQKGYRYFQYGHKCKLQNPKNMKYATLDETIRCDCTITFNQIKNEKEIKNT